MSLPTERQRPTWIVDGGCDWYHALTPVEPFSSSGYGSVQNGPSALRPGAPGWIPHVRGDGRSIPPSERLRTAARGPPGRSAGWLVVDGVNAGKARIAPVLASSNQTELIAG